MFWENSIQTCILCMVKQITSPGGMYETSARGWCMGRPRGTGWRGRWEGGWGWEIHVTPWLIHVNVWQNPLQCCKVISLQLIKINEKEKEKKKKINEDQCQAPGAITTHDVAVDLLAHFVGMSWKLGLQIFWLLPHLL